MNSDFLNFKPSHFFLPNIKNHTLIGLLEVSGLFLFLFFLLAKLSSYAKRSKITYKAVPQAQSFRISVPYLEGLYILFRIQQDGVRAMETWRAKFGSIYQVIFMSYKFFVVSDASVAQKVLMSSSPFHLNKPQCLYDKVFVDTMRDGLANSEYNVWTRHRKMVSSMFTYKSLQSYLPIMNLHAEDLVKDLMAEATQGEYMNSVEGDTVWESIYFHAIKIMSNIVYGLGIHTNEECTKFHHEFIRYKRLVIKRLMNPHLHFPPIWYLHPMRKEYNRLSRSLDTFGHTAIKIQRKRHAQRNKSNEKTQIENVEECEESMTYRNIEINSFKCLIQEMLEWDASDKEICDQVGTFITAGHETVVLAMQMLIQQLALNPKEQARCREEIERVMLLKQAGLDDDEKLANDQNLNMNDLSSLKHLERCILESLRVTPIAPMFARRLDAPLRIDDDLTLPEGTNVAITPWTMHREPNYFPDAEKFIPDRFLPENVKQRHAYAFLPFSGGPRNCIGYKVAIMEMKVIISQLLYHFEIFTRDKMEDVKIILEATIAPERNYNIIFKRHK